MALPVALRRLAVLGVAVSLLSSVLLVLAYTRARPELLSETLRAISPASLAIGLVLHLASLALWALRVWLLARPFSDGFGLKAANECVLASVFTAALTPGRVGGEPARFAVLVSHRVPAREAGLLVLLERAMDLVFFIAGGVLALLVLVPLLPRSALVYAVGVGIALAIVAILLPILVLWRPRLLHGPLHVARPFVGPERAERAKAWVVLEAARLRRSLAVVFRRSRWAVPAAAVLTAASWLLEFAVLKTMLDAAGAEIPLVLVLLGAVVIMLVSALPVSPGGAGVAELGAYAIFAPLSPGLSPAFVIAWRATTYYVDLALGGAISLRFAGREVTRVFRNGRDRPRRSRARDAREPAASGPQEP